MGRPLKSVFKKEHRDDIANRSAKQRCSSPAAVFSRWGPLRGPPYHSRF